MKQRLTRDTMSAIDGMARFISFFVAVIEIDFLQSVLPQIL